MSTITESIGRVLAGRYRIESALGSGASANVFAAFDTTLQRRVAVKVLHPALAVDGAFLRRFRSEAQSAAALAHAHVLAVYDWGEDTSGPFLVLEFLGGGSLRDMLDEGARLTVPQAVAVGIQAAEGLAYAHGRGFVHRDVKPANLLFDEEGRLRVADFGLARALAEAALTEPAGTTVGTARYAAPEQALGHRIDGRADVYALALALYEAVTGDVPFSADTTISTLMARVGEPLPGHEALGPLAPVLEEAAAPEADDRLDAAGLAARLRELARELPTPEPLPLAGAGGAGVAPPMHAPDQARTDVTEHGMAVPLTSAGRRSNRGGKDPDVLAFATAVGIADESAGARSLRRRRWPWTVAALVVVTALAVTGVVLGLQKTKLLTPSHKLPVITGLTVDQANALLRRIHLHTTVVGHRTSITAAEGVILRQIPGAGTKMKEGSPVSVVLSSGLPVVPVPVLSTATGGCPAITAALAQANLKAVCSEQNSTSVPSGVVIDWNPKGQATYGSTITVTVSKGPPAVTIPPLTGFTCQGATTALQGVGLVANCTEQYSSTVPSGEVVDWNPKGQAIVGSTVSVIMSKGPEPVTVPGNLYSMTVSEAIGALQAVGLVPLSGGGPLSGHVFLSNPPAGSSVLPGTQVTLYSR
jgi:serine/threonine-protein kinase